MSAESPTAPIANGYTDLPRGRIAAIATTLEMRAPPPQRAIAADVGIEIEHVACPDLGRYRRLFREIGEPWLWHSRLRMSDETLAAIVRHVDVEVWVAAHAGQDIGLLELDFRESGACELAFFGFTLPWTGRGAGRRLMAHAIARAWARPIRRFWVHTCTLDHPSALAFYRRSGFEPVKIQLEVAPDPRLDGTLSADAAPGIPIIR